MNVKPLHDPELLTGGAGQVGQPFCDVPQVVRKNRGYLHGIDGAQPDHIGPQDHVRRLARPLPERQECFLQIKLRHHIAAMVGSHNMPDYPRIRPRRQHPQRHTEKKRGGEHYEEKGHAGLDQSRLLYTEPDHVQAEKRREQ